MDKIRTALGRQSDSSPKDFHGLYESVHLGKRLYTSLLDILAKVSQMTSELRKAESSIPNNTQAVVFQNI